MPFKKHSRQYDVVIYGATGYTGLLTAEFIASHFPTNTKWAVAGRSAQKLEKVVKTCQDLNPDREPPKVEVCSLNDADLVALAKKTFILITTVGPYSRYGEYAFKACAEAGTHYVDCTGEAVWHAEMIKKYGAAAKASGARMFPQSAVESGPPDLVTFSLALLIKSKLSASLGDVVVSLHEIHSAPSGGTLASVLGLFEVFSFKQVAESHKPYALSPIPNSKPAPKASVLSLLTGAYYIPNLGLQSTSITAGTDTAVVQRTWGLFQQESTLRKNAYGPNFTYREFTKTRNTISAMAMHYGLLVGGVLLAFCAPFRNLMRRFVFQPGQGPTQEDSANDYIEYRGVAIPDIQPAPGKQALCRAWFQGSMYSPWRAYKSVFSLLLSPMASPSASSGSASSERTPLLRQDTARPRTIRNVTFNPNPVSRTIDPEPPSLSSSPGSTQAVSNVRATRPFTSGSSPAGPPPMLSALNNRLRRRNSHGSVFNALPPAILPKMGPQRSSKTAEKLKLLPNPELEEEELDEESNRDVYSQYTRIKDPMARRDAARLGKADRERLPRVTAYCTANKYQMENLMRFLKGRGKSKGANPKLIDECIYSPYNYGPSHPTQRPELFEEHRDRPVYVHERRHSTGELQAEDHSDAYQRGALADFRAQQQEHGHEPEHSFNPGRDANNDLAYPEGSVMDHSRSHTVDADFDTHVHTPEVFLFDYGVVVIWGMSITHEQRFLKDIAKFELEKLDPDDVETECFNFYYTREYQARIYNDFITLRDRGNYMTKLAISHALAQSVKTSLFEELLASTIDACKDIPTQIALAGKIALSQTQINMQIGELFILRINIHLNGSLLDTPELFWVEPHLEPVYQAVRSYLEMDQRVGLLTERLDVIADLLAVLKDQLSHGHGEMLEWIVIVLIAAEILVAAINIVVDLYAGV
ncbi:hypothetical protein F5B22DRAFT_632832 [Xylaria bambusicola]|uniref:uncharacterized protein n=1 Tax=Xylaria bambusicola TaxID=326684 RepID=UPI002007BDBA|nr:uncharacterized protein F5B22DRAFT_632832 [Xylaria bambusicola]KAI0526321.1 hypothetical protein F5B22DRAFT_632832 [Xylaria bambusicola]